MLGDPQAPGPPQSGLGGKAGHRWQGVWAARASPGGLGARASTLQRGEAAVLGPAPGGDGERARQARTVAGARSHPASDSLGAKGQGRRGVWACESGASFLIVETEPRAAVLPTAEPGSFWPGSRPSCGRVGATWWDPWPRRARAGLPATSRASGS